MFHVEHSFGRLHRAMRLVAFSALSATLLFAAPSAAAAQSSRPSTRAAKTPKAARISSKSKKETPPSVAPAQPSAPIPPLDTPELIGMASEDAEVVRHVQLGLQDLLLGWDESARLHFRAACAKDAACPLAHTGLLLTSGAGTDGRAALEKLLQDETLRATPAEIALVGTLLRLVRGDVREGVADEFSERADRFRADVLSACWAVLLLHDGYEADGTARAGQAKALERSRGLYVRHGDQGVVCYLRALMEETAPEVSDEAVAAARAAVEKLPGHPAPHLLLGHLLYRRGDVHDSIAPLHRAAEIAAARRQENGQGAGEDALALADASLELRASLYEATALWSDHQDRASLLLRRRMNALPLDRSRLAAPGSVLLRWEANTLPLRILVLREKLPTEGELAAAVQAATPTPALADDLALDFRDCLHHTLRARLRAAAGKRTDAARLIQEAEKAAQRLAQAETTAREANALSVWIRAGGACAIAVNAAKAATYADTADIWKQNLAEAQKPSSYLLPPSIPERAGQGGKAKP